ncbi:hypothetical protein D3C84_890570 [compost metagenome]
MCALEQADAQTFGLEAAGAVVRLFSAQVALDARQVQFTHVHCERHAVDLAVAGSAIEQGKAGKEGDMVAAGGEQLLASSFEGVRLAENLFAEHGDLVGADDQVLGVAGGQGLGFLPGQALDQLNGRLFGQALFVNIRGGPAEGQAQAFKQFAPVGRAGSQ